MKKFFSIFALTMMFLAMSTVANAQWNDSHFGNRPSAHANDQADYNRCRDEVRSGDYNYQYGLYEASLSHYEKARHYNNCCRPDHRYISTSEIDRRIDDCRRAMHRNDRPAPRHTTYHHSSSSSKDAAVGAAVGGVLLAAAIGAAVASSKKEAKQQAVSNSNNTSYNTTTVTTATAASNQQLSHFDNGSIAYDATCSDLQIKSIERTPEGTVVNFEFLNLNKADNIYMARSIYMKDRSTNQKLRSLAINGLDCTKRTHVDQGDSYEFSVTFPALADNCHEVDIVESPTSSWKFYHVNF